MSRLIQAAKEGRLDLVQEYLKEDDVNECDEDGRTALHQVIIGVNNYPEVEMNTRIEIMNRLIAAGIQVNTQDNYHQSAIHYVSHIDFLPVLNKALHVPTPHCSTKTAAITSVQNINTLNELSFFNSSTLEVIKEPEELVDFDGFGDFIKKKFTEDSQEYEEEFIKFKNLLSPKP